MVITLTPALYYLLLSIILLILTFVIVYTISKTLRKKMNKKWQERGVPFLVAVVMLAFYFAIDLGFADRASFGDSIVSPQQAEKVEEDQVVLLPFGDYVVIERLYEFGYVKQIDIDEADKRMYLRFQANDPVVYIEEYHPYIHGNGWWNNEARFDFATSYEKEWEPVVNDVLQSSSDLSEEEWKEKLEAQITGFHINVENDQ